MKLSEGNPKATLTFYDSNPHPSSVLTYLANVLLMYGEVGNSYHDSLITKALRVAIEHPACTTRNDRSWETVSLILSLITAIDKIAEGEDLGFISHELEGYIVYQFVDKE